MILKIDFYLALFQQIKKNMKNFLTLVSALALFSGIANAQTTPIAQTTPTKAMPRANPQLSEREEMPQPLRKHALERREHEEEMKRKFDALSPAQKEAVKKERERHHQEMKKITGSDDFLPPHNEDEGRK
jgi:Skp family chaperone for outer membrane proteins